MPRHINVMDLKVGDVVRIKSLGPNMTVCSLSDKMVECIWFYEGTFRTDSFIPEILLKVDKDHDDA